MSESTINEILEIVSKDESRLCDLLDQLYGDTLRDIIADDLSEMTEEFQSDVLYNLKASEK